MFKRFAPIFVIAALAAGLGLWAAQRVLPSAAPALPASKAVTVFATPREVPAFSLQQAGGQALTMDALKGHWTIVFLGFTHCPDVCPTTLAQLAIAQRQWGELPENKRPRVLFVSADPERDSPDLLAQYAHSFHPDTLAATAPLPELERFTRSLSLVFMKAPSENGAADDYSIDHSAAMVLLNPQVQMAGVVQPPFDIQGIAADLTSLTKAIP